MNESTDGMTRRERRKLEVRRRILEATVSLFEERGIAGTKVAEICTQADIAHKTFFNHFPSKAHLLREIARYALNQLLAQIEEARKQPVSTRARIRYFFETVAAHSDEAGPMHREMLSEMVHLAHETGSEQEQARKLHEAFGAIVREGASLGDITTAHSEETLTEMMMGAYYALMFNFANLDDYPLRERALATAAFLADSMTIDCKEPSA